MKYVNLQSFNFGWTQVAINPYQSSGFGGTYQYPQTVTMNGCFGVLYILAAPLGPSPTTRGAFLVLVNKAGQICTYQTPDFVNGSANNIVTQQPWNIRTVGNTIQWNLVGSASTFTWSIPSLFTPGGKYVVSYARFNATPPCPGGGALANILLLGQQGLIAYEYVTSVGQTGTYTASIYNKTNQFIAGGLIAQSSDGSDPFNKITSTLPPATRSTDVYVRNGVTFFANGSEGIAPQQCVGVTQPFLNGNYQNLVCGSPSPQVNVVASEQQTLFPFRDWGCPGMSTRSDRMIPAGATDVPGYLLLPQQSPTTMPFISRDWWLDLASPTNVTNGPQLGYVAAQKSWFYHQTNVAPYGGGPIYVNANAFDPLQQYGPLPQVQQTGHNGLINMHRAVSINGSYIT